MMSPFSESDTELCHHTMCMMIFNNVTTPGKYSTFIAKCPTVRANDSHQTQGTFSDLCIVYYQQEVSKQLLCSHKVNCQNHTNSIYAQVTIARIWSFVFLIILSLCASICTNNTSNQHNIFQSYFYTMIV